MADGATKKGRMKCTAAAQVGCNVVLCACVVTMLALPKDGANGFQFGP